MTGGGGVGAGGIGGAGGRCVSEDDEDLEKVYTGIGAAACLRFGPRPCHGPA